MDIETARDVVRAAFRSSSELQKLLDTLKERCRADEYQDYARNIAAAIDGIGVSLINKALVEHPELRPEIETSIAKDGHYT
jgi:hypothetical protein